MERPCTFLNTSSHMPDKSYIKKAEQIISRSMRISLHYTSGLQMEKVLLTYYLIFSLITIIDLSSNIVHLNSNVMLFK